MFLVYEDWTLEIEPRCFYVGKGTERRVRLIKRNGVHTKIAKHFGLKRVVILRTDDEAEAIRLEVQKIAEHHTYVYGEGYKFGANFTVGGEGVSGKRHTIRSKARISAALRKRVWTTGMRAKIGKANSRPVEQLTLDGHLVERWPSGTQAAKTLGFARTNIVKAVTSQKPYRGFLWRRAEYSPAHGTEHTDHRTG